MKVVLEALCMCIKRWQTQPKELPGERADKHSVGRRIYKEPIKKQMIVVDKSGNGDASPSPWLRWCCSSAWKSGLESAPMPKATSRSYPFRGSSAKPPHQAGTPSQHAGTCRQS